MRILGASLALTFTLSAATVSGPYDGLYRYRNQSCNPNMLGMDGGPVKIQENVFIGVEMGCELTNPTNIRGMNATLYDGKCGGEGEEWEGRYMVMKSHHGIYWIHNEFITEFLRCLQ